MHAVVASVTTASATKSETAQDRPIRNFQLAGYALGAPRRVFCTVTQSSTTAASGDRSLGGRTPRARTHLCDDETLVDFWPASLDPAYTSGSFRNPRGIKPWNPPQQIPWVLLRTIRHNRTLRARSRPGTPLSGMCDMDPFLLRLRLASRAMTPSPPMLPVRKGLQRLCSWRQRG